MIRPTCSDHDLQTMVQWKYSVPADRISLSQSQNRNCILLRQVRLPRQSETMTLMRQLAVDITEIMSIQCGRKLLCRHVRFVRRFRYANVTFSLSLRSLCPRMLTQRLLCHQLNPELRGLGWRRESFEERQEGESLSVLKGTHQ
jgi:hypothetical protein